MHVIRHNHVSADGPAMAFMRRVPFLNQNLSDLISRQHCSTILCTHGDEINRRIYPDSIESLQMFMHRLVVADVTDLDEPEMLPQRWPRSATRGYSRELIVVAGSLTPARYA